jgi:hypothetical protein
LVNGLWNSLPSYYKKRSRTKIRLLMTQNDIHNCRYFKHLLLVLIQKALSNCCYAIPGSKKEVRYLRTVASGVPLGCKFP